MIRSPLKQIYKGEHFVLTGETLYRKLDDDEGFEAVDGEMTGSMTPEWFKHEVSRQDRLFVVVDPVKWSANHSYWKEL